MNHHFYQWLRNYFGFSQTEIKGFFCLLIVFVGLLVGVLYLKFVVPTTHYGEREKAADKALLAQWIGEIKQAQAQFAAQQALYKDSLQEVYEQKYAKKDYESDDKSVKSTHIVKKLFVFNPNTVTVEELEQLGFPQFLAQRIDNYRQKGGRFKLKADLQKIYGMPADLYEQLYNYIDLPEGKTKDTPKENTIFTKNNLQKTIDLNQADTTDLIKLRGIGSKLANRIVSFREKLGGFYDFEQLKEVYGLSPEAIAEMQSRCTLPDKPTVRQLNINTSDEVALKNHPYIGYKLAGLIVAYRKQHGNYKEIEDLLKIKVMTQEQLVKMKPYLAL
jgi:competence ComEA-like helix-hairpin-helix protein